jgi:hypothetical protein
MAQEDNKTGQKGTNLVFVMTHKEIDIGRATGHKWTSARMVVDYQPQKEEPKWIGIAVGGNLFTYKGNTSTQTANLTTPKQLWNSVLSIDGARYMCINIKISISRQPWIIMPSSLVSLHYHTHKEFLDLNKDQRNELSEWTKANGGKKKGGGKRKGDSPRGSPKAGDSNKRFKTMISEMEGSQNKMFEAMAEVQQSSIAAIHASASPKLQR